MMHFTKKVYNELIKQTKHESCGFVMGYENIFGNIMKVKNKAKRENYFKVGFIDKIKIGLKLIFGLYHIFALWHVHKNDLKMSKEDIKNAQINSYSIIIANGKFKLYCIKYFKKKRVKFPVELFYKISESN